MTSRSPPSAPRICPIVCCSPDPAPTGPGAGAVAPPPPGALVGPPAPVLPAAEVGAPVDAAAGWCAPLAAWVVLRACLPPAADGASEISRVRLADGCRRAGLARRGAARIGHAGAWVRRVGLGDAGLTRPEPRVAGAIGRSERLQVHRDRARRRVRRAHRVDEPVDRELVAERAERVDRERLVERVLEQRLESGVALPVGTPRVGLDGAAAVVEVVADDRQVLRELGRRLGELVEVA